MLEFEHVTALGGVNHYRNVPGPSANTFDRDVITDPRATEVNQAWIHYKKGSMDIQAGRQRFTLDNHRFIGNVGWRQNEQTFDAVTLVNRSVDDLEVTYAVSVR